MEIAFGPLHDIFELGYKWDIDYWQDANGDVMFRAEHKGFERSTMNVHYEFIHSGRRDDENYVAQKLELFRRRLAE